MKLVHYFPADTTVLSKIGDIVADTSRKAGFTETEVSDIQLAIDEACTNTIIHGLQKNPNRTFQLAIEWNAIEIEFLIHEAGTPFDPSKLKSPDQKSGMENRPPGGWGIYFIRKIMDIVEFITDENGNKILYLLKRR